jgi:catechol 2,3-dioxygenase-like lactoylglutathione lyase family enzyme
VPVTDVDRAKTFYVERAGFILDVDHRAGDNFRVVQLTPPGSSCSISIGMGLTNMAPGSINGLHLVVDDITLAREEMIRRGVEVSEIRHMSDAGWKPGPDPAHSKYNSFADFKDPDGNQWLLQEART